MELKCVKFDKEDGIPTVTLNRMEKMNALSPQLFGEIGKCFDMAADDEQIAAVIITGGEKVFSAGMDIAEMM